MRALAQTADGDLALARVNGMRRLTVVSGVDAIAQRLRGRLRLWAGEWFIDVSIGVPYLRFLGQKNTQALAEATLRRAITSCPGIATLEAFALTLGADRSSSVAFRVRTTDGEIIEDNGFRFAEAA